MRVANPAQLVAGMGWSIPLPARWKTFELRDRDWMELGRFADDDRVEIAPFDAITLALTELWC